MRARELIDGAAFGPDALKAIGQAFDEAWAEIAHHFGSVPADIDKAQFRLATALLSVASLVGPSHYVRGARTSVYDCV
jgi:hypothetical protein